MDATAWDERYAASDLVWSAEPNSLLAEQVADLRPRRALDLACGEGRNAVWLAEGGWAVTAVDFSAVALAKGRGRAKRGIHRSSRAPEVDWVEADVTVWPFPPDQALVVVLYLHLPGAERDDVLARAAAALAPGGTLLVIAHDRTNLADGVGGPQDPAILWDPDEAVAALGGLRVERAERVRRAVGDAVAIDTLVRARSVPEGIVGEG